MLNVNKININKNIFLIGIIIWLVFAYIIIRVIPINKHPLVIIGLLYPIMILSYNYISEINDAEKKYEKTYDNKKLLWLFDRIHTNSLYIATGVFALNGITQQILGKSYMKIIPFYILTILFGVCINLVIYLTKGIKEDILISKIKTISLTYGISFMSIGILYTLSIIKQT